MAATHVEPSPQSRSWLPSPFRAVEWFAPDDSSTSPRGEREGGWLPVLAPANQLRSSIPAAPVYGGATRIPAAFGSRVGQTPGGGVPYAPVADAFRMSLDSAFWIWNLGAGGSGLGTGAVQP